MMKRHKKRKTAKPEVGLQFTVRGEWLPGVYPVLRSGTWSRGEEDPLATEMRLFGACTRWAFNRLREGYTREALKKQGQEFFGLNSRYVDDAILKAKGIIDSRKELLTRELSETVTKLSRANKKLAWAKKNLEKAVEANDPLRIEKAERTVQGRKARVEKLSNKLDELKAHQENGTIPTVVFGGRTLWERLSKGRATKEEWRDARQNRLYARGDATKAGNPHFKIRVQDGGYTLSVTISHLSERVGTDKKGRPLVTRAPQVAGKLWLPEKHRLKVRESLTTGAPYTVELIRGQDGRCRAHITFVVQKPDPVTNSNLGYLGVDTNPDGVALANTDYYGRPEPWPEGCTVSYPKALHKFTGEFQVATHPNGFLYLKIPELSYSRGNRRTYLAGVLAQAVVDIARALGKPLAVENLAFSKDRLDTNKRFNRMASNFPYQKLVEAILRKAFREGVGAKLVWPAHTSTIGYWKYAKRYGVPVHHAAACVIARRAAGIPERISKELKARVQVVKERLPTLKVDSLPGEGTGMTRKAKRLFKRLDEKMPVYNGLARFRQESFRSVWRDLKELALLSR